MRSQSLQGSWGTLTARAGKRVNRRGTVASHSAPASAAGFLGDRWSQKFDVLSDGVQ